jgi:hypothetical protein
MANKIFRFSRTFNSDGLGNTRNQKDTIVQALEGVCDSQPTAVVPVFPLTLSSDGNPLCEVNYLVLGGGVARSQYQRRISIAIAQEEETLPEVLRKLMADHYYKSEPTDRNHYVPV